MASAPTPQPLLPVTNPSSGSGFSDAALATPAFRLFLSRLSDTARRSLEDRRPRPASATSARPSSASQIPRPQPPPLRPASPTSSSPAEAAARVPNLLLSGRGSGGSISSVYDETSPTALVVQGILEAAAAGILVYMAAAAAAPTAGSGSPSRRRRL